MIQKKICMVGSYGVGKTSLVARFVRSIFSEKYQTTVGVKIDKKVVSVGGENVTLMLWDLAGEEEHVQVRPAHLTGSAGYILVADGLRAATLDVALSLHERARKAAGPVPFVLVVNKNDQKENWEIAASRLGELANEGWPIYETSAKTGDCVETVFLTLAGRMLKEGNVG